MTGTIHVGGPSVLTTARLAASGGRSDRLRIVLTIVGSALGTIALLCATAVVFIGPNNGPYRLDVLDQRGLHPGVIISMLLLCVPIFSFVGQCSRVGAPARDRRLASLRMAGATPGEIAGIAAAETGISAAGGAVIGTAAFSLLRSVFGAVSGAPVSGAHMSGDEGPGLLLPTDVAIPWWAMASVIVVVAAAATVFAVVALRRVIISPFGVTRSMPSTPPTVVPAILLVGGTLGLVVVGLSDLFFSLENLLFVVVMVAFVACVVGLVIGSASVAATLGRFLAPRANSSWLLIASRRMVVAPYAASRASSAVVIAVLLGAATQVTRSNFLAGVNPDDRFYADTFILVEFVLLVGIVLASASLLVVTAEAVVERRRTFAALAASGTPRSVLARAVMAETLLPLIPTVVVAVVAGVIATHGLLGDPTSQTGEPLGATIPFARLSLLLIVAVAVSAGVTAGSLVLLRRSASPTELRAAA